MSVAPFDALDFAVLRDPTALRENQSRLARAVGFDPDRLHQAMQVHGARVLVAGDPASTLAAEADALVAEPTTGDAVLVRVADCVPVLLADPTSGRVGAAHAGWRGIEAGVLRATAASFVGARGIVAAVGPSIGPCCFEVGDDVAARISAAAGTDVVARGSTPGKVFVDLRRAVRTQLVALGIDDVEDVPGCTRCDAGSFYSYRRDGDDSGRLAAVIVSREARPDPGAPLP